MRVWPWSLTCPPLVPALVSHIDTQGASAATAQCLRVIEGTHQPVSD